MKISRNMTPEKQVTEPFRPAKTLMADAVYVRGGINVVCGTCGKRHVVLDDPRQPATEFNPDGGSTGQIQHAMEDQRDTSINHLHNDDNLIDWIRVGEIDGEPIPEIEMPGAIAAILNIPLEEATNRFEATKATKPTPPKPVAFYFGKDCVSWGTLGGITRVEGCCENKFKPFEDFFRENANVFLRFIDALTATQLADAESVRAKVETTLERAAEITDDSDI